MTIEQKRILINRQHTEFERWVYANHATHLFNLDTWDIEAQAYDDVETTAAFWAWCAARNIVVYEPFRIVLKDVTD